MQFKQIREAAVKQWYNGLQRTRRDGALSDDYTGSLLCDWQRKCIDDHKHCALLCSLGDWLDNISDLLTDERFDNIDEQGDIDALFRFYTRIMLAISEVVEDFITVHKQITDIKKKLEAGKDFEQPIFYPGELAALSEYINSVTKHKTERKNLHVNNHHQKKEFEDFGATYYSNQISLKDLAWESMNKDTTILIPSLSYLVNVIIALNKRFDELMRTSPGYVDKLNDLYTGDYLWDDEQAPADDPQ